MESYGSILTRIDVKLELGRMFAKNCLDVGLFFNATVIISKGFPMASSQNSPKGPYYVFSTNRKMSVSLDHG
jgi:hypothetical protein